MISFRTAKWLLIGSAIYYGYTRGRSHGLTSAAPRARRARARGRDGVARDDLRADPSDPVQSFESFADLNAEPLSYDATSAEDAEMADDLSRLDVDDSDSDSDQIDIDQPDDGTAIAIAERMGASGSGELYGVHTPRAESTDLPDDDQAFEEGQNWLEALQTSAAENGADPEHDLDIIDEEDMDRAPHASMSGDRPVADLGSAGPRGL